MPCSTSWIYQYKSKLQYIMYFSPMCTSKQLNWKTIITNYSPNIIHPGILPLRMRSSKLRMRISTPRIFMKSKLMCLIIFVLNSWRKISRTTWENIVIYILFVKLQLMLAASDAKQCGIMQTKCTARGVISCATWFRWTVDGMYVGSPHRLVWGEVTDEDPCNTERIAAISVYFT